MLLRGALGATLGLIALGVAWELTLAPLSWSEARQGPLAKLRFGRAAGLYIASQGVPSHLRERLCDDSDHPLEPGQLPAFP